MSGKQDPAIGDPYTDEEIEQMRSGLPKLRWVDMFGIDPTFCDGKPIEEWLDENRGEA